jgi:NADP-dependent 3-hydroxy acid dehydrogenase YdfG
LFHWYGRDLAQQPSQIVYTVVATARKAETLEDFPATLKLPLDVTLPDSVNDVLARTIQQFGEIDFLVKRSRQLLE